MTVVIGSTFIGGNEMKQELKMYVPQRKNFSDVGLSLFNGNLTHQCILSVHVSVNSIWKVFNGLKKHCSPWNELSDENLLCE